MGDYNKSDAGLELDKAPLAASFKALRVCVVSTALFMGGYYFGLYVASPRDDQEPEINTWNDGITEFMELKYNGERRQFLYHHSSGKCPHCNYSIPVSESLVPWGTEAMPVEEKDGD